MLCFFFEVFFSPPLVEPTICSDSAEKRESQHSKVFLKVEAATDEGKKPLPSFVSKILEFTAGDGHICDALECALVWRDPFWQEQKPHTFESKVRWLRMLAGCFVQAGLHKSNDSLAIGIHRDASGWSI